MNNLITSTLNQPNVIRHRKWRMIKDRIAKHSMTFGGISIIIAIVLIFFYLLYVVLPLLLPASMKEIQAFPIPLKEYGETVYLAIEEKNVLGLRITEHAQAIFFQTRDGKIVLERSLLPKEIKVTSFAMANAGSHVLAFGLQDGRALVIKPVFKITYEGDLRVITPEIVYPMGEEPLTIDDRGQALTHLDVQLGDEENTLIAVTADNRLLFSGFTKTVSFFDESVNIEKVNSELALQQAKIEHLLLEKGQKTLYVADDKGQIWHIDVTDKTAPQILQRVRVVPAGLKITALEFLTGDISLLVGDSEGRISQWFLVRDEKNNQVLTKIREFHEQDQAITSISSEERRKGFLATDAGGKLGLYHSTAHESILQVSISAGPLTRAVISPRADTALIEDKEGLLKVWHIENRHPEVSLSSLWGKVWYESHEQPKYIWQSSAANSDFEPKFSLTPLMFGTLKGAFYAMLIAIPLAILGALYTAYFMSPSMRKLVKPTIEIMEALPTVILGFLAGLWLAPIVETHLPGVFALLIFLPLGVLGFAYLWQFVPKQHWVSEGWHSAVLIPVIILLSWAAFATGHSLEILLFGGDMRQWLTDQGIDFDQRNALVVGIAMGLAIIPCIFSITEDAIFSVPKHLTSGSLALGATPWQTMIRIVILTASPGIFSAVMIGIGRAVGETMIVLMATGNTAIMDFNIFEGLRTLSANIAVEMPESEVNSTHYRLLFLSGLVLFIFTFFFNTLAEIVRQRLRRKYSSL